MFAWPSLKDPNDIESALTQLGFNIADSNANQIKAQHKYEPLRAIVWLKSRDSMTLEERSWLQEEISSGQFVTLSHDSVVIQNQFFRFKDLRDKKQFGLLKDFLKAQLGRIVLV